MSAVKPASAIFFGTPEFAVPCLRALCEVARVSLVVTQPDRPAGRGMKLAPPPVKVLAQERGIEVIQPTAVRKPELAERLRALEVDVAVVVAYGRILPKPVLDAPRLGCVNVHASLLPKLRGAAPIQWSILRGETHTGVCLMRMDEGMDTGPVLASRALEIGRDERAGELSAAVQDHAQATLAPLLTKEHGRVDFRLGAAELHALVRGTHPWPGAFAFCGGQRIKLHRVHVLVHEGVHGEAGSVLRADRHGIEVACGRGVLVLDELQPDGKRVLSAEQFCAGLRSEGPMRFAVAP